MATSRQESIRRQRTLDAWRMMMMMIKYKVDMKNSWFSISASSCLENDPTCVHGHYRKLIRSNIVICMIYSMMSFPMTLSDLCDHFSHLSLALRLVTVYHLSWDVLLWTLPLGVVWRRSCSLELMVFLLTLSSRVSRAGSRVRFGLLDGAWVDVAALHLSSFSCVF